MQDASTPAAEANPDDLLTTLRALEVELHHPGTGCSRQRLEQLLHPDFHEVGRSGRAYTRETVIAFLAAQARPPQVVSDSFAVALLAPGVALLTYRSAELAPGVGSGPVHHALRSSLWLHTPAGWQLRHHQGTPAAAAW
jgi:hypothetical protein